MLPALRSEELWRQPLVAATFDNDLRARMLATAEALPSLLDELDRMPMATPHGDACTRNLLVTDTHDGFTMIDFGFWGRAARGPPAALWISTRSWWNSAIFLRTNQRARRIS